MDKLIYQGKEFIARGSIVANIAVAENDAGQRGVFDIKEKRLLFGLCECPILLHFDEVNNLMATAYKVGSDPVVAVVKGVAEPI